MVNPFDHVKNPVRDLPHHLSGCSIVLGLAKIELSKILISISSSVYGDELLENIHVMPYHLDLIPGSFAFCHINQMVAKSQIIKALKLEYNYLWHNKLKVLAELNHMVLKKLRIHKVILQLEGFFENFRIAHNFEDIKGVAPNLDVLTSIGKKLFQFREEVRDYLVGQGMAIPKHPYWGKDNNPEEWLTINDYKILCTCNQHEVERYIYIYCIKFIVLKSYTLCYTSTTTKE